MYTKQEQQLIDEAATKFGIGLSSCELIRHNENITCKVEANNEIYSLRIHCPVEGFDTSLICANYNSYEFFLGEVALLKYMRENGFINLQKPIAGPDGQYVYQLSGGSPVMLLSWIQGHPIVKENVIQYMEQFAKLTIKIHKTSKGFQGLRSYYDENMIDRLILEMQRAVDDRYLKEKWGTICKSELLAIKKWFLSHNKDLDEYGIIHSDLGLDNILDTGDELIPIDFSLSGYAPYALDAAMLMLHFPEKEQKKLLVETIKKNGEKIDYSDVELFFSLDVLLFICAQYSRHFKEEWFQKQMDVWCSTLFTHGERI